MQCTMAEVQQPWQLAVRRNCLTARDQASRWLAYALLEVEKGFNRLSGWRDLPALARALERPPATSRSDWAATPREFMTTSESQREPAHG